jgi:hypothetical protein
MEFLRIVSEPSRCQLVPASGQEISISLLSPATSSQYLSGIIEAALPVKAAETAVGRHEPTTELRRNIAERIGCIMVRIYALRRGGKAGISLYVQIVIGG